MSKINEFRTEMYRRLPAAAKDHVLIFEAGKITSQEKPWFRTFLTDSDQGAIGVYLVSERCYDEKWRETILLAIEKSVVNQKVISLNDAGGNTFQEQMDRATAVPTVAKKGRKEAAKGKVETPKRKRGRPRKNS